MLVKSLYFLLLQKVAIDIFYFSLFMTEFDSLSEAINTRTPIDFSYPKPGKITGNRIGNPHAIYRFTSKDGKSSTKVHIWQTG